MHSATKYLGGHSDVIGGFVAVDDAALADRLAFIQNRAGAVPSPFDCYLVLRGVKTLAVRMDRHCRERPRGGGDARRAPRGRPGALPGPAQPSGNAVAVRQMRDFGGMVSFIAAGGEAAARAIVGRTQLFFLAESLGGVESLIGHSASMSHSASVGTRHRRRSRRWSGSRWASRPPKTSSPTSARPDCWSEGSLLNLVGHGSLMTHLALPR